jgi:Raf kinase inhibitor-like YbhB/YbcL family protein
MELKSSAFEAGGMIPKPYTCDGQDASPPLSWSDVPNGAKSLALIADDPDAPMGTWVHWVAWNIPTTVGVLEAHVAKRDSLPNGMKRGTSDFRSIGYGGLVPLLVLTGISSNCMPSIQPSRCHRARRRRIWRK